MRRLHLECLHSSTLLAFLCAARMVAGQTPESVSESTANETHRANCYGLSKDTLSEQTNAALSENPVERALLHDLVQQKIGAYPLEVLNYPTEFLGRTRDRLLRSLFLKDAYPVETQPVSALPTSSHALSVTQSRRDRASVVRHSPPREVLEVRRALIPTRPELRGFSIELGASTSFVRAPSLPNSLTPAWKAAADIVASRLARDGLLETVLQVIDRVGCTEFRAANDTVLGQLNAIGVPIDWLEHFNLPGMTEHSSAALVQALANLPSGSSARQLALAKARFTYRQQTGFRVGDESGAQGAALLRMQVPDRTLWSQPQSGDVLDVLAQVAGRCPQASILVSIHQSDLSAFLDRWQGWPDSLVRRLTVIEEPMPVAQWAQDNAKPGMILTNSGEWASASLLPRYASQNEDGSVFVPNESFMAEGWAQTGHKLVQSPLLFQGGNVLAVNDPTRRQRVLLIGEAELLRNTSLGLTAQQVLIAFAADFGVDRCIVLPSVSFHIDLDVSIRSFDDRTIAFVNDTEAAVRLVLTAGLVALQTADLIDGTTFERMTGLLKNGEHIDFLAMIRQRLKSMQTSAGVFDGRLVRAFVSGPLHNPNADLRRFLLAVDIYSTLHPSETKVSTSPAHEAFLNSFGRRQKDHHEFVTALRNLGWSVATVPGLSEGDESINYLNGIHEPGRYLMPAYGGLYESLDRAAIAAFERVLGSSVDVLPIATAAVQRRAGGLHCVVASYPKAPDGASQVPITGGS